MSEIRSYSPVTRAVRAAIATDVAHGAVVPPIHLSSTFAFEGFNRPRRYDYTRSGNPTRSQLADALAALEGGAGAVITSTGMSAVTLVLQLLRPGDVIVAAHDCYGGTQRLLRALAQRGHFELVFADLTAPDAASVIQARRPRVVWIETPSNPLLRITDIRKVAKSARAAGALVVVDNTFLSPVLQQPIALGADLVVHSTTKYLNGHSDVVGGAVVAANAALAEELTWWANCLGVTGAPFDSYLTLRGVRTLHARVREHLAATDAVVDLLRRHPAVTDLHYPGLPDHPGHAVARAQQSGFGAMVSFEVDGGVPAVELLASRLRCFTLAESLGGVESLIAHPATMTHASMDAEARRAAGISDALVRLSVGIESPEDLAADLEQALDSVAAAYAVPRAVPRALWTTPRHRPVCDVVVLGAGSIGRELVQQVIAGADGVPLRICALADRSGHVFDPGGLTPSRLAELCALKEARQPLSEAIGGQSASVLAGLEAFRHASLTNPILVDATPADTSEALALALSSGFDLVLANKVPLAGSQAVVDRIVQTARAHGRRLLHEATVGAGLPVMDTLRKLQEAGDDVVSIEGCPSGTLGYLFGEISRGEPFSVALKHAISLGYTEPDPRIDLSGIDAARKALILGRALGFRGELSDLSVESLVPADLTQGSVDEFLSRAHRLDDLWAFRANDARRKGKVWRYRVHVTRDSITVGLAAAKLTEPLGVLRGTDNQFTFTTTRYRSQPLVITGPGAGPPVTAAGVLNDLLTLARLRTSGASSTSGVSVGGLGKHALPVKVSASAT